MKASIALTLVSGFAASLLSIAGEASGRPSLDRAARQAIIAAATQAY